MMPTETFQKIRAAQLARDLNLNRQTVYKWQERGRIPAERVKAVAQATGLTLAELRPDLFADG